MSTMLTNVRRPRARASSSVRAAPAKQPAPRRPSLISARGESRLTTISSRWSSSSGRSAMARPLVITAVRIPAACDAAHSSRKSGRSVGSPPWNLMPQRAQAPRPRMMLRHSSVDSRLVRISGQRQYTHLRLQALSTRGLHLERVQLAQAMGREAPGQLQVTRPDHAVSPGRTGREGPRARRAAHVSTSNRPAARLRRHQVSRPPSRGAAPSKAQRGHGEDEQREHRPGPVRSGQQQGGQRHQRQPRRAAPPAGATGAWPGPHASGSVRRRPAAGRISSR